MVLRNHAMQSSGQRREVVCYEVKLSMNLANQIFCHLCCTPLRPVDYLVVYLKRERPLNNQLQPLTSKTDKKLLEVFLQMPIRTAKNRSAQPEIQLCTPVRFVGANIAFFAREMA